MQNFDEGGSMRGIVRRPDGSIDQAFDDARARRERSEAVTEGLAAGSTLSRGLAGGVAATLRRWLGLAPARVICKDGRPGRD